MMKAGELFAGYGGLALAVEHVFESQTAWVCEHDEAPAKILAHRFPNAPNHQPLQGEPVMTATITLYTKTTGCMQCFLTKKALTQEGIIDKVKIIEIDQPENAHILENLKAEGLLQAPIIMLNFPITHGGQQITEWSGFIPTAIHALANHIKEKN